MVQRCLEQNREAARKSRMRKKLELDRTRKQVAYGGSSFGGSHMGDNGIENSGARSMEYDEWANHRWAWKL
ncbi:hypothetical protein ABKV19_016748 [Rosa sericea]